MQYLFYKECLRAYNPFIHYLITIPHEDTYEIFSHRIGYVLHRNHKWL